MQFHTSLISGTIQNMSTNITTEETPVTWEDLTSIFILFLLLTIPPFLGYKIGYNRAYDKGYQTGSETTQAIYESLNFH